jgi:hypothetical protein
MPTVVIFAVLISVLSFFMLVIEFYFAQVYTGPMQSILVHSPIVVYVLTMPLLSTVYSKLSVRFTNLENPATQHAYDWSLTTKSFVMTAIPIQVSLGLYSPIRTSY